MRVATRKAEKLQDQDVLLGLRVRVKDADDGRSFREGLVTHVKALPEGREQVRMRVDRRVVGLAEQSAFDAMWEFESDILMSLVEIDWNAKGIKPGQARGVMSGRARAGV
jgi:hypothetical protein